MDENKKATDTDGPSEEEPSVQTVEEVSHDTSLDLHLDISLPAIVASPDRRPAAVLTNLSPKEVEMATSLLMSDERALLKDL